MIETDLTLTGLAFFGKQEETALLLPWRVIFVVALASNIRQYLNKV
ncbi:MAG: hypothetical protein KDI16_09970 [Halioglobus sp.]|nr:hypothetical protein [Halioglobus sp.]